jgi:broad specificity phosphatase PhoE
MAEVWCIRHGQASLFAANYDVLSAQGREQARALGTWMAQTGLVPSASITGPAERQRDTASLCGEAIVAAGGTWPSPDLLPGFDEHDAFGLVTATVGALADDPVLVPQRAALEIATEPAARSRAFQRIFEEVMGRWLRDEVAPSGIETWPQFAARVEAALDEALTRARGGARVAVFTSVGPIAVVLRRALAVSDEVAFRMAWRCRNTALVRLLYDGRRLTLDGYNALPHLPEPGAWTYR